MQLYFLAQFLSSLLLVFFLNTSLILICSFILLFVQLCMLRSQTCPLNHTKSCHPFSFWSFVYPSIYLLPQSFLDSHQGAALSRQLPHIRFSSPSVCFPLLCNTFTDPLSATAHPKALHHPHPPFLSSSWGQEFIPST